MHYSKLILGSAAALALTACATTNQPSLTAGQSGLGNAVKHNMAAQMVAPTPEQKADTYIPANPARKRLARKTYEEGEVPEPKPLATRAK